jgi:hypothetical protein
VGFVDGGFAHLGFFGFRFFLSEGVGFDLSVVWFGGFIAVGEAGSLIGVCPSGTGLDGAGVEEGKGYSDVLLFFDGVEVRVVWSALEELVEMILGVLSVVGCREKIGFLLLGRFDESMGARLYLAGFSFEIVVPANVSR